MPPYRTSIRRVVLLLRGRAFSVAILALLIAGGIFAFPSAGSLLNLVAAAPIDSGTPPTVIGESNTDSSKGRSADGLTIVSQYDQGFEIDGEWAPPDVTVNRVPSGTDGIISRSGSFHAKAVEGDYTRWGSYNSVFPGGGYTTSVDIYLNTGGAYANDRRFDFSSAINRPDGNHRRDFVFNCGFYNDVATPGTGNRFVCSASNDGNGWPKNPGRDPFVVTTSPGWYKFEHHFRNNAGVLAVDLNIYNAAGQLLKTWTLSDSSDLIGTTVGGNRYGWFVRNQLPFLAIDNANRTNIIANVEKVTQADLSPTNWFFYNDENDTINNSIGSFVVGPGSPAYGVGGAQISVSGTQRRNLATYRFAGTPLADINELKYRTYNPSAGNGGSANRSAFLNFNVDFDGSDTWQRRIAFVPANNGTVIPDSWKEWDAINGGAALWIYSGPQWPGDLSPGTTPKTWSQILTQYPGVRIRVSDGWFGMRVGDPYADGYTENIDSLTFGTAANTTVFDFEPGAVAGAPGWFSVAQRTGAGNYVAGPAPAPIGVGSFGMTTGAGNSGPNLPQGGAGTGGKVWLTSQQFDGTMLADITELKYSTYVSTTSATTNLTPSLQFQVDLDGDGDRDTAIAFEPVYSVATQGPITPGVWQEWDALAGKWWLTNGTCFPTPDGCYVDFSYLVATYPNAKIMTWYALADGYGTQFQAGQNSAGPPWTNFDGNVDKFVIGINGVSTTTDFDPTTPTVTVNHPLSQPDPTSTGPIHFTATFSEPVVDFDSNDVDLSASVQTSGLTAAVTGGPTVYDIAVTGMNTDGAVIASIPAGTVQGTTGVPNDASTSTDNSVYFVATCNSVSIPTTITSLTGVQVVVPINVDDLTGRSAFGYDTTINYDPAVLSYVGIEQVGTLSSGLTIVPNWASPGTLSISAFSTTNPALTGSGTLLNVRFQVIGSISGTPSPITFSNFVFNEGNPCSTTANGAITVISGTLSGTVTYVNGSPTTPGVPNVNMAGTGTGGNVSATTDGSGNYSMSGFGAGGYTVTPSKAPLPLGSFNSAITNVDSTRIAQHNVGLITLNANQIIAGDVTGNGTVSNLDSTYIAQWKVGTINPGTTGTWVFQPISRSYTNLNASISGENYNAILKGDVTGNWNPAEAPNFAPVERPSKNAVILRVGDVKAVSGSEVTVPIDVTDLTSKGVTGYEFEINYDPRLLEPADVVADVAGTISEGRAVVSNSPEEGRLLVVVYGIFPIEGKGRLLNLHFSTIGKSNTETPITLRNLMLNENEVESYPVSGSIHFVQNSDGPVIRGRLIAHSGDAISSARVSITDTRGRSYSVRSNSFGAFEFGNLKLGEVYTISAASKDHRFTPRTVVAVDGAIDLVVMSQ